MDQPGQGLAMADENSGNGLRIEILTDTGDSQPTIVKVFGEIDIANAAAFGDSLAEVCERGRHVIVDIAGVTFIDSSGVNTLLAIANQIGGDQGAGLVLRNPTAHVRKVLEVLGLDHHFGLDGERPTNGRDSAEEGSAL